MDIELFEEEQRPMPKFNQDIMDGLAYKGLRDAKGLVDRVIRCAEKSYPEDFTFLGSQVCLPQEAHKVMTSSLTRGDRNTPTVDLAPSDVYLVKYLFAYKGKELYPRYFYLPFVRRGGLITIAGKQFSISPVATDPCFSPCVDYVFIRMSRAPVTFKRVIHTVVVDGVQFSKYVAYSWLHHRGGSNNKTSKSDTIALGRVMTTLPHYLFCKYGFAETFKKFGRCDVKITTEQELKDNPVDHKKFVVVTSNKVRPSTLKVRANYALIASPMALVIPRNCWNTLTESFAAGFFYVVDHYPERQDPDELADKWLWKLWMGYLLAGDQLGNSKLVENIDSHLASLDDYVDIEVRRILQEEEGLEIDNIYELFAYMLVEMDDMISKNENDLGSMYGKRLVTAPYVLRDIYEQIFRCLFEITNNRKRKHGVDDYNKILGKYFMPTIILNLRKTSTKPFMSSVSTPGDNMFMKITSRLVMQAQTSTGRKPQNINVNDPLSHLHPSWATCGNYGLLLKSSPLAKNTINPTVRLDGKDTIEERPELDAEFRCIEEAISRNT